MHSSVDKKYQVVEYEYIYCYNNKIIVNTAQPKVFIGFTVFYEPHKFFLENSIIQLEISQFTLQLRMRTVTSAQVNNMYIVA